MATGVSAIAMGTGHPGAGPAGGGERWDRSALALGRCRRVRVGTGLPAGLGEPSRPNLMPPRPFFIPYCSPGLLVRSYVLGEEGRGAIPSVP